MAWNPAFFRERDKVVSLQPALPVMDEHDGAML